MNKTPYIRRMQNEEAQELAGFIREDTGLDATVTTVDGRYGVDVVIDSVDTHFDSFDKWIRFIESQSEAVE